MIEYKVSPGYGSDGRKRSYDNPVIRAFRPLVLMVLVLTTQIEWLPIWYTITVQSLIGFIGVATFIFTACLIYVIKNSPTNGSFNYINPLLNSLGRVEFFNILLLCVSLYLQDWTIVATIYSSANGLLFGFHWGRLSKKTA